MTRGFAATQADVGGTRYTWSAQGNYTLFHGKTGTREFVVDGENGYVCAPQPEAIAAALSRLAADRALAPRLGRAGLDRARRVTWDGVVEQLLG